jgi:prevent-host-death family protein
METSWTLREARAKLSELIDRALADGPQTITRDGEQVAVVVSAEQFRALTGSEESLVEFFQNSPLRGLDLDLSRDGGDCGR